jgi:hypothetical protein
LHHVDQEPSGGSLGGELGVQRAGLQPNVAGLDLGEILLEGIQQRGDPGLGVMAVVDEFTLLLGLGHVGKGQEVVHLDGRPRACVRARRPPRQDSERDHKHCAGSQQG